MQYGTLRPICGPVTDYNVLQRGRGLISCLTHATRPFLLQLIKYELWSAAIEMLHLAEFLQKPRLGARNTCKLHFGMGIFFILLHNFNQDAMNVEWCLLRCYVGPFRAECRVRVTASALCYVTSKCGSKLESAILICLFTTSTPLTEFSLNVVYRWAVKH